MPDAVTDLDHQRDAEIVFRFSEWGLYWPREGAWPLPVRIYEPSWTATTKSGRRLHPAPRTNCPVRIFGIGLGNSRCVALWASR